MALWKDKTQGDWYYDFQYLGQRYSRRGHKTKKAAAEAMAERRKQLKEAPPVVETDMTFFEAAQLYLDYSEKKHTKDTYKGKKRVIKAFLNYLGKEKLTIAARDITPAILAKFLSTRHSNYNFNFYRKDLSAAFTYAKEVLEVIDRNPVAKVAQLPHESKAKVVPSEESIVKLLLAADPKTDEKDLLTVLLHTIARIDEVLRLTWSDVNFEKRILTKKTKKTADATYKNIEVKINDELYATLWKRWQNRKQDTWVFYNEDTGTRYMHRPKFMKGLCKRAGIVPHFGFHTLRHLMASLLADNPKVTTKTIQTILGHANIKTTEIYVHSVEGSVVDAMDSLSGIFKLKDSDQKKARKA